MQTSKLCKGCRDRTMLNMGGIILLLENAATQTINDHGNREGDFIEASSATDPFNLSSTISYAVRKKFRLSLGRSVVGSSKGRYQRIGIEDSCKPGKQRKAYFSKFRAGMRKRRWAFRLTSRLRSKCRLQVSPIALLRKFRDASMRLVGRLDQLIDYNAAHPAIVFNTQWGLPMFHQPC